MYDFLIVGAGLAGCTFAHIATENGCKCIVVERQKYIGGTCATENVHGIMVHKHGAHIFKTSNRAVWDYVNGITPFSAFLNTPKAVYEDRLFSLPINMNTFHELWGVTRPDEAMAILAEQIVPCEKPKNLEEYVLSKVGRDVYKYIIEGYTEKQWGRRCEDLPPDTMRRIPIRMTYNNNYYDAEFQGIPKCGYTEMMNRMISGVPVMLCTDWKSMRNIARHVIYTGAIDELFGYSMGELEYRSLKFRHVYMPETDNYQGVAVVNHADKNVPYTRTIEHKHFLGQKAVGTILTYETPCVYEIGKERYYPIDNNRNRDLYNKYREQIPDNMSLVGRLAEYRYIDMAETISSVMRLANELLT